VRGLLSFAAGLALIVASGRARAQAAGPSAATGDTAKPAPAPADDEDDADDDQADDETSPKEKTNADQPSEKSESSEPTEPSKELKRLPPPPPPRSDEQEPRPYLYTFRPLTKDRHIEVGPDAGVWFRTAKGDSVAYGPGVAWGIHARAELWEYLGFTAYFSRARHSVDVPRGSLGLADTEVDQPPLDVTQVGARLEPTLRPTPTLRLWLGLGVGWGHIKGDAPTMTGANAATYADRTGAYLEYSAALGATWDVIPNWLAISLSASGGLVTNQSGDLFHDHQVIGKDGTLLRLAALPELESSYAALLGVGIVL
jgi:hypothetical protein